MILHCLVEPPEVAPARAPPKRGRAAVATAPARIRRAELSVEIGDGLPLPVSWSLQNVSVLNEQSDEISCAGQITYSVRDNKLRADLSQLVACGGAIAILYGFDLDFGCAGKLLSFADIDVALTGSESVFTVNEAETGPFKTWIPEKPFPLFIGETKGPACASDEYREAGYPACRACGNWSYSGGDASCRVFGTHHVFHPESGEVVIEPGPDMPLPVAWNLTMDAQLNHSDSTVVLPPCTAQVHTSVRDGLLIADVSEFQTCAVGLPPGAGVDFGNTILINYGCAGNGCATQWFGVKFDGSTSVYSECFSEGDWPPRHYD
jgi:hypothetical protein